MFFLELLFSIGRGWFWDFSQEQAEKYTYESHPSTHHCRKAHDSVGTCVAAAKHGGASWSAGRKGDSAQMRH